MSLRVWLPLNGDLENKGLDGDLQISSIGTLTFINNGKIGKCYQRASSSSQTTTGININDNFLNIFGTKTSVAMWVKPLGTHTHYNGTLLSSGNWNNKKWAFGVNQNNTKVDVLCGNYNNYIDCQVPINIWTHLVSVYDNGTCMLYKNGEFVGQLTNQKAFQTDALNACIGRQTYANGYFGFNGLINDVRIYDHALSLKQIKEISKGLVLHYKLDDKYIEPTTNLITTQDCLSSTCYNGAISKYNYGTNTDMYKQVGIFQGKKCTKVYNKTNGTAMYPYVYISNMFTSNGTNAPEYKTLSFDYYSTVSTTISPYKLGAGTGTATYIVTNTKTTTGTGTNSVVIPVEPNMWNHIEITFHGTTDADAQWGYIQNQPSHTSDTSNYWLFANMQLETKDHATGYAGVGGTRANSECMAYDSSGYQNNGTIVGNIQSISDSPKYAAAASFDGDTSAIQIPFNTSAWQTDFTINLWFKKETLGTKNYETLFGGPSGFEMDTRAGAASTLSLYMASTRGGTIFSPFEFNKWYMVTLVNNGINQLYYINGKLKKTIDVKPMPAGNYFIGSWQTAIKQNYYGYISDFRIYATVLSSEDIKELYQKSVFIDRNQNLYVKILLEDSNKRYFSKKGISYFNQYIQFDSINNNIMPNSVDMQLGSANAANGVWRLAGSNTMTRTRVQIKDSPIGLCYGFQNEGVQTYSDGSCYGIDGFPFQANTQYTISMWARIINGTEGYAGYNVYSLASQNGGSHNGNIIKNYRVTTLDPTGKWTRCWYTFTTNGSINRNIYIGITTGETGVTTQMCGIKIEKGAIVTPWKPKETDAYYDQYNFNRVSINKEEGIYANSFIES